MHRGTEALHFSFFVKTKPLCSWIEAWRREKNPWRRHNYSGLSSSFINLSCLEGLYKSQHEKIVCQHYTVYLTGTHLTTTSASLQIKLSQKSKSILFYLHSISVKHLNNLLSPIPVSSAPFKDFAKNFFSETRFPPKKYHRISKPSIILLLCLKTSLHLNLQRKF